MLKKYSENNQKIFKKVLTIKKICVILVSSIKTNTLKKKGKNMKNTLKKKKDCYYANGKKFDSFKDALVFIFANRKGEK